MTRDERSAQAAGIAGYCFLFGCGGIVLIALLAQLFGQFRHVMPDVREWLIAHTEAAHQVVVAWIA